MKLHSVNHDMKTIAWCGPSAISAITGVPTSKAKEVLLRVRQERTPWKQAARLQGASPSEMVYGLIELGHRPIKIFDYRYNAMQSPTLAKYLRERGKEEVAELLLIELTGHYVVIKGRKFVDNHTMEPVWLRSSGYRRSRVKRVWYIGGMYEPSRANRLQRSA